MADLRKVINGLEACVEGECAECDYREKCSDAEDFVALARDALELLKAQTPIKPVRDSWLNWRCGNCRREIDKYEGDVYCPGCGRKVDWND